MNWVLYVIECSDKTLYTGITTDLDRRISQHEQGLGAKYTRGRGPFTLRYSAEFSDRASASIAERQMKSLSRAEKLELLKSSPQ